MQVCDGEKGGKKKKQNGLNTVKRGRTGDTKVEMSAACSATQSHGEISAHAALDGPICIAEQITESNLKSCLEQNTERSQSGKLSRAANQESHLEQNIGLQLGPMI